MTPPPESTPVLFAGNAQYPVLAAVRALRAAGYAPWLAVDQPGTYAGRSRATVGTVVVPDPAIDSEGFVREFTAAATRLSVAAVLPAEETHLHALAGREADFSGIAFGVPSLESVEQATNKGLLPELAAAAKLRTPPTTIVRGDSKTVGAYGFPAVVKPLRTWIPRPNGTISYHPVRYVTTEQTAEEAIEDLPGREGLVQPYISGTNVSISGVSWEGELVCALHHISERIWPVTSGVTAFAKTIPPNPKLEQGVGNLLRAIRWSGPFEVEFRRSPRGEHYLIDLNPRIYGSLALAVAAGLNLPGIWVDLLLGRQPSVGGYRVGTRFRQEENDARALAGMLVNGEFRRVLQGLMPQRGTTHAIFSLRDPMPLLTSATKLAKRHKR
jgi:predicted ATP-grasp superfamily ATP-dependent carboligase